MISRAGIRNNLPILKASKPYCVRNLLSIFSLFFLLVSCKTSDRLNSTNNWDQIFNGKSLEGWTMKIVGYELGDNFANTFRVKDGLLQIRYDGYGDNFDNRFGGLYYNKNLQNYRLKVEYRFVGETAAGAPSWGYRDSGVQFHSQDPKTIDLDQPFPVCLEYNLHGGNGTDERPVGEICTNGTLVDIQGKQSTSYCTPAQIKKTFHGDQWVTLEIDVQNNTISHYVNGELILTYNNPRYNAEHDLGKRFTQQGMTFLHEGFISLQSNSHPIDFRRIELIEYN